MHCLVFNILGSFVVNMIYNLWLVVIVTIFPETIILPAAAKPETVNVGKSDKIATSIVKMVWFLLESINMNVASPKGEVTATCLNPLAPEFYLWRRN